MNDTYTNVVKHPVDIGSTLYIIWRSHNYVIAKCTVKAIIYDADGWRIIYRFNNGRKSRVCFPSDFGETVFKTFDEANNVLTDYLKGIKQ